VNIHILSPKELSPNSVENGCINNASGIANSTRAVTSEQAASDDHVKHVKTGNRHCNQFIKYQRRSNRDEGKKSDKGGRQ
jgi:hypothetical protein